MIIMCLTIIVNNTSIWNPDDQKHLDRARVRCGELYPDAPCVKKFEKVKELQYRVTCGE